MPLEIPIKVNTEKIKRFLIKSFDKITLILLSASFLFVIVRSVYIYIQKPEELNLILTLTSLVGLYFAYELIMIFRKKIIQSLE